MPYIAPSRRHAIDQGTLPRGVGELNYVLTQTIVEYVQRRGISYATLSEVRVALSDAGTEFYRRIVGPYEDRKAEENGDVYEPLLGKLEG